MRRTIVTLLALLLVALPALAGEGKGKCTAGTQECLDKMASHLQNKGLIGLDGEWDDAANGYVIAAFMEGSTAEKAGVKAGDVLVAINGIALSDQKASQDDDANRRPGASAKITVMRGGEKHKMNVTLIGLNDEQIAKYLGEHMIQHVTVAQAN